jgi:hypothetical protein
MCLVKGLRVPLWVWEYKYAESFSINGLWQYFIQAPVPVQVKELERLYYGDDKR